MRTLEQAVVANLNAKNDLETFGYLFREKMDGQWKEHATNEELRTLEGLCDEVSGWLYGEGEDVTKAEYDQKKAPLKSLADKIAVRYAEWAAVPAALKELEETINLLGADISEGGEKYSHISREEMEKATSALDQATATLTESKQKWSVVTPKTDPTVLSLDVRMRRDNLNINVTKILSTPKPAPPPPEPVKTEETKMEEEKPAETGTPAEGTTPMETEVD